MINSGNEDDYRHFYDVSTEVEFAVDLTCENCVKNVHNQLDGVKGIEKVNISLKDQSVIVDTTLPSFEVQQLIEKTGKHAVFKGFGSRDGKSKITSNLDGTVGNVSLGAAVAQLAGESGFSSGILRGVVRFVQSNKDTCVVEGTIDGLKPGQHKLQVHECGDISKGCDSVGDLFNPPNPSLKKSSENATRKQVGDLGSIKASSEGRAIFRFEDRFLKVWDIIGRSLVVADDFSKDVRSDHSKPNTQQHTDKRLACAIIARSAGLFENNKQICACDGVSIWDERNRPLTGPGRRSSDIQENEKPKEKTDGVTSYCSVR